MTRETIKSIVIAVLFGLIIVLLRSLWMDDSVLTREEKLSSSTQIRDDVAYLLEPKAVNVSFGRSKMTTFFFDKEDIFDAFKPSIAEGIKQRLTESPISTDRYYEERKFKSVEFVLPSKFPTDLLLTLLTNEETVYTGKIEFVEKLMFISRTSDRFYIYDGDNYFEVITKTTIYDSIDFVDQIEKDKSNSVYKTVSERFYLKNNNESSSFRSRKNEVLIPEGKLESLVPIKVVNEIDASQSIEIQSLAKNVFGSRLNFVQEVIDVNGAIVLLYGYGDKALKVTPDGSLEYSEKIDYQKNYRRDFLLNLNVALDTIEKLGSKSERIYLSKVTKLRQGNADGFGFEFEYRIDNTKVIDLKGFSGVKADVYGEQISSFTRNIKNYYTKLSYNRNTEIDPFYSMIDKKENFNLFYENFKNDSGYGYLDLTREQINDMVLKAISDFYMAYVLNEDNELVPAYAITFGDRVYYIDYFTNRVLESY
ncbi:hypothetical protein DWB64_15265 [Fusibacter sp. A1]|uniref:hypothetical protein n=1 Tax=Fusibacter sp. A2 TaxID=2929473 RepID=UPI00101097B0|nr:MULTISPECIES: hypothetical protein [unclassified Fusibacter]MCK8060893.1 hypothetical protein [Fusibacter sp. A2]NPE23189.1 hypothetical protein [Fusibacter sp. A1]RXV59547.1 hypothetical protein DWB64_15265 [Fusibacter sp. A1]